MTGDQEAPRRTLLQEAHDFQRYRVADPVEAALRDRRVRHMLYLVAYDICDPKRLRRVANTCLDYGIRVEKSVFECDLKTEDFTSFWNELMAVVDSDQDAVVAYRICGTCSDEIQSIGAVIRPEKRVTYVI